ncbi:MAG: S8 family serine peptidase [Oligoflexia bacterium]|nr:S8 family serine peptidase [Oligoflexia bacterium]
MFKFILSLGLLIFLFSSVAVAKNQMSDKELKKSLSYPSKGIIIKVKEGKFNLNSLFLMQNKFGIKIERKINSLDNNLYLAQTLANKSMFDVLKKLNTSPMIEIAEPNYVVSLVDNGKFNVVNVNENQMIRAAELHNQDAYASPYADAIPNDPMFNKLWGLQNLGNNAPADESTEGPSLMKGVAGADIDALRAWEITKGDRKIKIASIDTGVDYNHPDLKANMWVNTAELNGKPSVDDDGNGYIDDIYGYDFASKDGDPMDEHNHGTHTVGTIAAVHNNGIGVAGVMANASIVAIRFLDANGSGTLEAAIEAIDYATKLNVDIMSNSWGGGGFTQTLKDAIDRAKDKGIVFVAAAGNSSSDNDSSPQYPATYDCANIVSVAAHNVNDALSSFSCYGKRTVHVVSPGEAILSTVRSGQYATYSGTSMATPHMSGIVGLLLSKEGRMNHDVLRDRLLATSVPVPAYKSKVKSKGRINAYNVLTNTRPPNTDPNPSDWIRMNLDAPFESAHPYADNANIEKVITVPNAKFVRVLVKKYELEANYDFLKVIDNKTGAVVESITNTGENYVSEYIQGDTVKIQMTSDVSITKWGFIIEAVEYVRK